MELGKHARGALDDRGLVSVAAPGFQAPGVLVYYSPIGTENPVMMSRFKDHGLQIAMGMTPPMHRFSFSPACAYF